MSKLEDYLKIDLSKLAKEGNYQKIREVENYLNKMSRQRLRRLEKANIKINDDRIVSKYSSSDFQSVYINKYKATNKDLKKYQNQMFKQIGFARHFLNLKTSKVKAFKRWSTHTGIGGQKFIDEYQRDTYYRILNLLKEIEPSSFGSWGSEVQNEIAYFMTSEHKSTLTDVAQKRYNQLREKLKRCGKDTIQYQIYEMYFKRGGTTRNNSNNQFNDYYEDELEDKFSKY